MKYSIKMRASKNINGIDYHISGAERIVEKNDLEYAVSQLEKRALSHDKGEPDFINIKIEKVKEDEILYLKALKTRTVNVDNYREGLQYIVKRLKEINIERAEDIVKLLCQTSNMRGAILLDIKNFRRLEKDKDKGIRATYMDYEKSDINICDGKNHYLEAIVLATKVANAPGIEAELCISDDPDYITGYIATKNEYTRITKLKKKGSDKGARIFLFNPEKSTVEETVEYLENQRVLIYE